MPATKNKNGQYVAKYDGHTAALLMIKSTGKWRCTVRTAATTPLPSTAASSCLTRMTIEPEDEGTVTLLDTWSVLQLGSEDSN